MMYNTLVKKIIKTQDYYVVSVNFIPTSIPCDMMFISNIKRFKNVKDLIDKSSKKMQIVATSNISTQSNENFSVVDFATYTNEDQCISDNAGLMCINLLKKIDVKDVLLIGFDGFSDNQKQNFYESNMYVDVETERLLRINEATSEKLNQLKTQMNIEFLSASYYQTKE